MPMVRFVTISNVRVIALAMEIVNRKAVLVAVILRTMDALAIYGSVRMAIAADQTLDSAIDLADDVRVARIDRGLDASRNRIVAAKVWMLTGGLVLTRRVGPIVPWVGS